MRDGERFLPEALASLSAQTMGDWLCLALDDGSRDGTRALLLSHARRDPRFRVLVRERSEGIASALRFLLSRVETPWTARMDGDDVALPDRLRLQAAAAAADPGVELWGCGVFPAGDATPGWADYLAWINATAGEADIVRHAFTELPIPHTTWLARTAALRTAGGYRDGPFPEDYDLFLRLLRRGTRMAKTPEILAGWRDHPARATRLSPNCDGDAILLLKAEHFAAALAEGGLPHLLRRPVAIWGAGKTGRILAAALRRHGLTPACILDPLKPSGNVEGIPVLPPEAARPEDHLLLVAVRPRYVRKELEERFEKEGRIWDGLHLDVLRPHPLPAREPRSPLMGEGHGEGG